MSDELIWSIIGAIRLLDDIQCCDLTCGEVDNMKRSLLIGSYKIAGHGVDGKQAL